MKNVSEVVVAEFCKNNNIKYHFCMNILFLTTPFGDWYIPLDSNILELYHRSDNKSKSSANNLNGNYHCQNKTYDNIIDALEYIKVHDFNKIQREIKRHKRRDIFKKLNKIKERENEKFKKNSINNKKKQKNNIKTKNT